MGFSKEYAEKHILYDPGTGIFLRISGSGTLKKCGCLSDKGYVQIIIDRNQYFAHRLAWLISYGAWPKDQIDHINGIRSDNRLANLRECTNKQNHQNRKKPRKDSKSGFLGVNKNGASWQARIKVDGKEIYLGRYSSAEEAHEAYLLAKKKHHPFSSQIGY